MGPWRALMSRGKARPRYPPSSASSASSSSPFASVSFSSLSVAEEEQYQRYPFTPSTDESHYTCPRLIERIWPGLGLGFAQKYGRQSVEHSLLDSSSKERLGRPDLGLTEGYSQFFEQNKACPASGASPAEFSQGSFEKPYLNAGASLDGTKSLLMDFLKLSTPKQAESASLQFSMCGSAIRAPGFYGLQDFVIQADSVKRKRKKKMNKHKHRKLRRLARKSRKK